MCYLIKTGKFDGLDHQTQLLEMPVPPLPKTLDKFATQPSPKFITTHLPASLMPKDALNAKCVYVYRNAKDAAVSGFNHEKAMIKTGDVSFDDYAREYMAGSVFGGPYHEHVKGFNAIKHENLLVLRYEDIIKDHVGTIKKLAKHLGKELSDEMVEKIREATTLSSMRQNKDFNWSKAKEAGICDKKSEFIRKGAIGDWRNYFTDAKLLEDFNKYINDNLPTELICPDE